MSALHSRAERARARAQKDRLWRVCLLFCLLLMGFCGWQATASGKQEARERERVQLLRVLETRQDRLHQRRGEWARQLSSFRLPSRERRLLRQVLGERALHYTLFPSGGYQISLRAGSHTYQLKVRADGDHQHWCSGGVECGGERVWAG